jgi:cytochrome c
MCRGIRRQATGYGRQGFALLATLLLATTLHAAERFPGIGRAATPAEIAAWDIDVRPDFKGLPPGSGSVAKGQVVWEAKCASCHGTFGESNEVFAPIVGGTTAKDIETGRVKSLVTGDIQRTTLMKLSSISTLWDYVRRAMPWDKPKSLTVDEVYSVVAYVLNLGDIVPADFVLSNRNIADVQRKLPNRDGMTRDHGLWDLKGRPDVRNTACMKDCVTEVHLASAIPEYAKDSHGNVAEQNRPVGIGRGADAKPATVDVSELARRKACLSCHGIDKRLVGPALREVAGRYQGQPDAEAKLLEKLRRGGGGVWGPLSMPPNPDLPEGEARALIRWILAGAR